MLYPAELRGRIGKSRGVPVLAWTCEEAAWELSGTTGSGLSNGAETARVRRGHASAGTFMPRCTAGRALTASNHRFTCGKSAKST